MTSRVFDAQGRLARAGRVLNDPASTSHGVRAVYVLALLSSAIPAPTSGWVKLALGTGAWRSPLALVALATFALLIWRIVVVVRYRDRLDAPIGHRGLRWCRAAAVALMATGVASYVLQWFMFPFARAIFPRSGDSGIAFVVAGMWLAALATPLGVLLFEASRLLGFERWYREQRSLGPRAQSRNEGLLEISK
jgi:hypothetical protein